jgi:hypothetical protein
MNFTKFRFNNYQDTVRKKKLTFDYIMVIHNKAIHNHVFKNCQVADQLLQENNQRYFYSLLSIMWCL